MFLVFKRIPIFFRFIPSASFVERATTSGRLFRKCAFAAIKTGVSDIPFASLDSVFPVQGAMTRMSNNAPGPIGSASGMVVIGFRPVISSARFRKSLQLPNRLSVVDAWSEKIGYRFAPVVARFFNSSNTFWYVQ